ncbi:hypothetical protein BASA60_006402 [Batrachochytrium salamandrivorans]|nr:hypothetical protein BASA60_006402 [Batrachochytrium salamandrivorans]
MKAFAASIVASQQVFLGLAESTFQFVMYERFKQIALERKKEDALLRGLSADDITLDWTATFAVAAAAKLIAAVTTYPHEVIRTRMRQTPIDGVTKYSGLIRTARLIFKEEGIAALYGGMTAHLMRVVPNAAILFFCYETIIKLATPLLSQ